MFKNRKRKGFTLIELVIVIAIIGILVAIAVPRFTTATEGAKNTRIEANARTLASAVGTYMAENSGAWPTDADVMKGIVQKAGLSDTEYSFQKLTLAADATTNPCGSGTPALVLPKGDYILVKYISTTSPYSGNKSVKADGYTPSQASDTEWHFRF